MRAFPRFAIITNIIFAICLQVATANAQHYTLDTAFKTGGIDTFGGDMTSGIIHRPQFILPQVDNKKIVLAGYVSYANSVELMRLNYNGTFDSSFNDSGKVVITRPYTTDIPSAAMLYDTSKIFVLSTFMDVSTGWYYIAAYDFKSNGTLNTAFGSGGVAHIALSGSPVYSSPRACGLQTDGKFVILGRTVDPATGHEQYGLTRLLPNGSVDATYGSGGKILDPYIMLDTTTVPGSMNTAEARCGYLQSDNKFVVAGMFTDSSDIYNAYQVFVVRHNMDGSPDLTFGDAGGITLIKESNQDYEALAIATDSAGNSYILAHLQRFTAPFADSNFAVIKLDHNGHRVPGYGYNGVAYLQLQNANPFTSGFAVQKDGKVIMPGIFHASTTTFTDKFIVYRLDTTGKLDTSFNTGGQIITQRPGHNNDLCIVAGVQPDGKILLAGYDTLSATSICMRFTNYADTVTPSLTKNVLQAAPAFTGYVYPNPVTGGALHIHYTYTGIASQAMLQLYNASGKSMDMRSVPLANGNGSISYSIPETVPAGIYYIILTDGTGQKQIHPVTVVK